MQVAQQTFGNRLMVALKAGLGAAVIAFLLFLFTVGFKADLNIYNQLELTTQFGYFFNYVLIAGVAVMTWQFFGRKARGILYAIIPSVILFISYRAWLYYVDAKADGKYVFSEQMTQLVGAAFILAVFGVIAFVFLNSGKARAVVSRGIEAVKPASRKFGPAFSVVLLLFYPVLIFGVFGSSKLLIGIDSIGCAVLTYIVLAWGLNIVVGFAGLLDLGYVAFYAVGAYTVLILTHYWQFSFWMALPFAGILAATWGIILGFPVLRLRGDYLAIVTLAFGEIIRIVLQNEDIFGGSQGMSSKKATFFGYVFDRSNEGFAKAFSLAFHPAQYKIFIYYILAAMVIIMAVVITRLRRLPVGRAWEALREDEIACRSLGINTVTTKLSAFATGAMFGGFAGAIYSVRLSHIDYLSFTFMESVVILALVVLGGLGSLTGIAIATIVMIGGRELLRFVPGLQMVFGPDFDVSRYQFLWFGLVMVCVMLLKPRGFVSVRMPTAFLKFKKAVSGTFTKEGNG